VSRSTGRALPGDTQSVPTETAIQRVDEFAETRLLETSARSVADVVLSVPVVGVALLNAVRPSDDRASVQKVLLTLDRGRRMRALMVIVHLSKKGRRDSVDSGRDFWPVSVLVRHPR
jgi:hypothetical protein